MTFQMAEELKEILKKPPPPPPPPLESAKVDTSWIIKGELEKQRAEGTLGARAGGNSRPIHLLLCDLIVGEWLIAPLLLPLLLPPPLHPGIIRVHVCDSSGAPARGGRGRRGRR